MEDGMPGSKIVRSADRALEVLECLASHDGARSLADLTNELAIPKSTLHALLWTLAARGWVEVDELTGNFRIGLKALLVGRGYIEMDDVVAIAGPTLDQLSADTEETVHIGRLDGTSVVFLDKRESVHPLRLFSAIGRRLPAFTTALGKSILALLPDDQIHRHLPDPLTKQTSKSITDVDMLMEDLRLTRQRGYAIDNEESTEGIRGFAVALRISDPPHDAVSCAVPLARLHSERAEHIVANLHRAAEQIEQLARAGRPRATTPGRDRGHRSAAS
jgi:DNA-binding IclR family transcriptional regulator